MLQLEVKAAEYLGRGIAPSTAKAYSSAQKIFLEFCSRLGLTPLPASEETLILFVAELAQARSHATIRSYLSGVRHLHVIHGHANPLHNTLRLDLVLKGVLRTKQKQSRPRLPVTPQILRVIRRSLEANPGFDSTMLWAACCTAFFGFLRCSEFSTASTTEFNSKADLLASDVAVDSHHKPSVIAVKIKRSKTDQFGKGVTIYLGKTDRDLCPVSALLHYLANRPLGEGPLFLLQNGRFLSKDLFVQKVRQALMAGGIDSSTYSGHSFRIGAATTAAACGIEDSLIKTLGRWTSSAYQLYVKVPPTDLAQLSRALV